MIPNTKTDREKGLICMKKKLTIIVTICTLSGVALAVMILKDKLVSVPEAAEIFVFLLVTRVAVMLGKRRSKEVPEGGNAPLLPLKWFNNSRSVPKNHEQNQPAA